MENVKNINDATAFPVTAKTHPLPKILKLESLAIILLLFSIFKIGTALLFPPPPQSFASDLTLDNILNAVNKERTMRNLAALNTNSKLSSAAQSKSDDMIARHYFSHTDPEGNYIWNKIEAAGYTPYTQLGENLAIEFSSTDSLVTAWMNSPTHRANILQEGFKDQGMGLSFGSASLGQYNSAVANTFGALLVKTVKPAPAPTPVAAAPAPKPAPQPAPTTSVAPKPTAAIPAPQPAPATQKPVSASTLKPRSDLALNSTTTKNSTTAPAPTFATATPQIETVANKTSNAVLPQNFGQGSSDSKKINRYFVLALGVIVLYFLLADAKIILQNKLSYLDRKINNITILIISLIVIALMYLA